VTDLKHKIGDVINHLKKMNKAKIRQMQMISELENRSKKADTD